MRVNSATSYNSSVLYSIDNYKFEIKEIIIIIFYLFFFRKESFWLLKHSVKQCAERLAFPQNTHNSRNRDEVRRTNTRPCDYFRKTNEDRRTDYNNVRLIRLSEIFEIYKSKKKIIIK